MIRRPVARTLARQQKTNAACHVPGLEQHTQRTPAPTPSEQSAAVQRLAVVTYRAVVSTSTWMNSRVNRTPWLPKHSSCSCLLRGRHSPFRFQHNTAHEPRVDNGMSSTGALSNKAHTFAMVLRTTAFCGGTTAQGCEQDVVRQLRRSNFDLLAQPHGTRVATASNAPMRTASARHGSQSSRQQRAPWGWHRCCKHRQQNSTHR